MGVGNDHFWAFKMNHLYVLKRTIHGFRKRNHLLAVLKRTIFGFRRRTSFVVRTNFFPDLIF
jgi:hypothetical protein